MFTKILIANRGEIACRVIETAHKMGIRCVAVYSDADANAMHVQMADEAYHIGPAPSKDSYLKANVILDVAKRAGAQAVHPGYGFLSENPDFAQACADNNIVFIGPPVGAIESMGSKSAAKLIMEKANVPLVPGYHGDNQDPAFLKSEAERIGYPLLLKAAFGGGGKGMRVVENSDEFDAALASAKREAMAGFGNDTMLMERYLTQPRHVEIQVFADSRGNAVYLAERDCSVQRRHQKVVEEAPAPNMSAPLRKEMGEAAVRAAKAIQYEGAGTVEFLLDQDGSFYFMEMNTRLQVEHPVTEMITGQDLVKWQLLVASGETLPLSQEQVTLDGHAIEVRLYAEDPDNEFLPATGTLNYLREPEQGPHVRVDTGVRENDEVSAFYDPMIAKLIVWDESRSRAIQRMLRALDDYRISGVTTNLSFLSSILEHPAFQGAELETNFIAKHEQDLFAKSKQESHRALLLAALYRFLKQQQENTAHANTSSDPHSPWNLASGWRMNADPSQQVSLLDHEQTPHTIKIIEVAEGELELELDGETISAIGQLHQDELTAVLDGHKFTVTISEQGQDITVFNKQQMSRFSLNQTDYDNQDSQDGKGGLTAPMNGTVVSVLVKAGDAVKADQGLVIMEAMKMEYTISAPADGVVSEVFYSEGDMVEDGAVLVDIESEEE